MAVSAIASTPQPDSDGPLSVDAGYNITSNIKAGHFLNITADSGDIRFTATKVKGEAAGGHIIIEGNDGVNIRANNGHLVMKVVDKSKNTINVNSSGPVFLGGRIQDGSNGLSLINVNISSQGKATLDGTTYWGRAAVLSGLNVTAGGDIDISGVAPVRASSDGVVTNDSIITSTRGNVSLSGSSATHPQNGQHGGMTVSNNSITAARQEKSS